MNCNHFPCINPTRYPCKKQQIPLDHKILPIVGSYDWFREWGLDKNLGLTFFEQPIILVSSFVIRHFKRNHTLGPPQLKKSLKFELLAEIFQTPIPQKAETHQFYQLRWPLTDRNLFISYPKIWFREKLIPFSSLTSFAYMQHYNTDDCHKTVQILNKQSYI